MNRVYGVTSWIAGCLGTTLLAVSIVLVPQGRVLAAMPPSCDGPLACNGLGCTNPPCSDTHSGCKSNVDCDGCTCKASPGGGGACDCL